MLYFIFPFQKKSSAFGFPQFVHIWINHTQDVITYQVPDLLTQSFLIKKEYNYCNYF